LDENLVCAWEEIEQLRKEIRISWNETHIEEGINGKYLDEARNSWYLKDYTNAEWEYNKQANSFATSRTDSATMNLFKKELSRFVQEDPLCKNILDDLLKILNHNTGSKKTRLIKSLNADPTDVRIALHLAEFSGFIKKYFDGQVEMYMLPKDIRAP